jgi:membrane-associated phospholipid phosphatase
MHGTGGADGVSMTIGVRGSASERTWWRSWLILFGVSCLVFSGLFLHVASEVSASETQSIDQAVRRWVLDHQTSVGLTFFRIVTGLGELPILVAGGLIVGWKLAQHGARFRAIMVCFIPFVPRLIVHALKDSYQVNRPPAGLVLSASTSFPSGHTSASTAVALVLGYALVREGVSPRVGFGIAAAVPLLVGLSRVYLDMHWASDVVGGWIGGAAFAGAVCALYELMRMKSPRRLKSPSGGRSGVGDAAD